MTVKESETATDYRLFPMAFSQFYIIVASEKSAHENYSYFTWVVREDLTKFTCGIDNGYGGGGFMDIIAIGV